MSFLCVSIQKYLPFKSIWVFIIFFIALEKTKFSVAEKFDFLNAQKSWLTTKDVIRFVALSFQMHSYQRLGSRQTSAYKKKNSLRSFRPKKTAEYFCHRITAYSSVRNSSRKRKYKWFTFYKNNSRNMLISNLNMPASQVNEKQNKKKWKKNIHNKKRHEMYVTIYARYTGVRCDILCKNICVYL